MAIPGTAGTGAETTAVAVLYEDGQKLSVDHPALLPDGVLLDGSLLDTLPEYHRKSCAMDALAQGIESWWAKKATPDSPDSRGARDSRRAGQPDGVFAGRPQGAGRDAARGV